MSVEPGVVCTRPGQGGEPSRSPGLTCAQMLAGSVRCCPDRLREQLLLRNSADVFPYAAAVSRSIDVDHTIPYLSPDKGGPPGQTRLGDLGPHVRRHHRQKRTALAGPPARSRHLAMAITPRQDLPGQRQRHPSPRGHSVCPHHVGCGGQPAASARKLKRRGR